MPRRRGRPPVDPAGRSVTLSITLTQQDFDRYCVQAVRAAVSVPEIIRRELENKKLNNRQAS